MLNFEHRQRIYDFFVAWKVCSNRRRIARKRPDKRRRIQEKLETKKARLPKRKPGSEHAEKKLLFYMTFATSNGAFLGLDMAFLALLVIGHAQSGLTALRLQRVTLGAGLTFRTLALNFFSIFIHVVTNGAVFGLCFFIMGVVIKSADRTFQFSKSISF